MSYRTGWGFFNSFIQYQDQLKYAEVSLKKKKKYVEVSLRNFQVCCKAVIIMSLCCKKIPIGTENNQNDIVEELRILVDLR